MAADTDGATLLGNWDRLLREPRQGIMLHYDDSGSDAGALEWLRRDPRCHVSYNWLIGDEGATYTIAPTDTRAWHAGVCKPSGKPFDYKDANSAFYGVAIAAKLGELATAPQLESVVELCVALCKRHGWDSSRITGHAAEAWPRGRKVDPGHVMEVSAVQALVQARL